MLRRRAPPPSAQARQTMEKALKQLQETITPHDAQSLPGTLLSDVRQAALEIETELAARQSLRNMRRLVPLFNGMEHYSNSMGILCNGTPFLSWIWSPITLVLRIASEFVEAFERIMEGYSRIAESLKRFELLRGAYAHEAGFQENMAAFYDDILQFHLQAYKFVRRNGWKVLFLTSWGRFERRFDHILDDMERHGDLIDKEANARNIVESRQMRQDIRDWREARLKSLNEQDVKQGAKDFESITSWLKTHESDQLAIFESIVSEEKKYSNIDPWIIQCSKVKSWLRETTEMPLLWMQGMPGSGKTFLATQLVQFLKSFGKSVLCHFSSHSYASSITYEQILRSLVSQLVKKDNDLIAHVYNEYILQRKAPTVPLLESLLRSLLTFGSSEPKNTAYIWIVLDGLDECPPEKQGRVASLMKQLTSGSSSSGNAVCKVLISSRNSSAISNRIRNEKHVLSLADESQRLNGAIKQYAAHRLQSLQRRFARLEIDRNMLDSIENQIVEKSDGMFLYARLVLNHLAANIFLTADELQRSLNELPQGLSDFYQRILNQILTKLDERSIIRVRSVLGWVAFQKRPLKRLEFLSAVAFSQGDPDISNIAPDYIIDVCGALLDERQDTTLTFIHSSVKEFLQGPSTNLVLQEQTALEEHGLATVACLLSGMKSFGPNTTIAEHTQHLQLIKGVYGLYVYSTEFWTDYLLSQAQELHGLAGAGNAYLSLVLQLAEKMEATSIDEVVRPSTERRVHTDDRLQLLAQYPLILKHVKKYLAARSLDMLERFSDSVEDDSSGIESTPDLDGISRCLHQYQQAVRYLLEQSDFPGISSEELKLFKSQFRGSAFTCSVKSCPQALIGLESVELLLKHKQSHTKRFQCTSKDCQYPPFVSSRALEGHIKKFHTSLPAPRQNRKQTSMSTQLNPSSSHLASQAQWRDRRPPLSGPSPWLRRSNDERSASRIQTGRWRNSGQVYPAPGPKLVYQTSDQVPEYRISTENSFSDMFFGELPSEHQPESQASLTPPGSPPKVMTQSYETSRNHVQHMLQGQQPVQKNTHEEPLQETEGAITLVQGVSAPRMLPPPPYPGYYNRQFGTQFGRSYLEITKNE